MRGHGAIGNVLLRVCLGLSGAVLMHTLITGRLLRVIRQPLGRPISRLLLSVSLQTIVVYSAADCGQVYLLGTPRTRSGFWVR